MRKYSPTLFGLIFLEGGLGQSSPNLIRLWKPERIEYGSGRIEDSTPPPNTNLTLSRYHSLPKVCFLPSISYTRLSLSHIHSSLFPLPHDHISFLSLLHRVGRIDNLPPHPTRQSPLFQGYFLAGNSLNGWVIAGSLMLTNLSAANFTGMTGNVYKGNLSPIAWTATVIPVLIYFCAYLLPTFLRGGFTTIPSFWKTASARARGGS